MNWRAATSSTWSMSKHLQPDLFRYLFPLCLACWHDTLTDRDAHPFEDWQRALRRPHLFDAMMTPAQAQAVHAFILDSLLARLDRERGFVYEGRARPPTPGSGRSARSAPACR
ncbi:hypothetical protein WJ972_07570 [Achromobacter insuavis]